MKKQKEEVADLEVQEVINHKNKVPIWEKLNLTIEEAIEYTNIGRDTLYKLCNEENCNFVLRKGRNILIKRKAFEKFIENLKYI